MRSRWRVEARNHVQEPMAVVATTMTRWGAKREAARRNLLPTSKVPIGIGRSKIYRPFVHYVVRRNHDQSQG